MIAVFVRDIPLNQPKICKKLQNFGVELDGGTALCRLKKSNVQVAQVTNHVLTALLTVSAGNVSQNAANVVIFHVKKLITC